MTFPLWNYIGRQLPAALKVFAAYFSLLLVWFLKVFLPGTLLTLGAWSGAAIGFDAVPMRIFGFFLLGLGIVLQNLLFFLMLLLLVWFFLTLISPSVNSPIVRTVFVLVDPFITPIQKWLPRTKVDFSPLVAAGIFLVLKMVVVAQLIVFSVGLANYSAAGVLN